ASGLSRSKHPRSQPGARIADQHLRIRPLFGCVGARRSNRLHTRINTPCGSSVNPSCGFGLSPHVAARLGANPVVKHTTWRLWDSVCRLSPCHADELEVCSPDVRAECFGTASGPDAGRGGADLARRWTVA